MAVDFDDIATLAASIGPRPAGSRQERRAAHYVAERLRQIGVPEATLPIRVPRAYALTYIVLYLALVASVVLARYSEPLGFLISAVVLVLLALEGTARPTLSRLAASRTSQNVIGLIGIATGAPAGDAETLRRVVLTAHLDSARSGFLSRPAVVRWFRELTVAVVTAAMLVPLLQVVALATPSAIPWRLSLVPAVLLVAASAVLLEREVRGRPVPGANDDASGVAVVLATVAALHRDHPRHLETWALFTAGAEAGMAGIRQFLRENLFDPERTYFINVDSVGSGSVRYTLFEGLALPRRSSPVLVRVAGEVALAHRGWDVRPYAQVLVPTDQSVILAHGYQAIGVLAVGPDGMIPNWRQVADTPEHIDAHTTNTAASFVLQIIRRLDDEIDELLIRDSEHPEGRV